MTKEAAALKRYFKKVALSDNEKRAILANILIQHNMSKSTMAKLLAGVFAVFVVLGGVYYGFLKPRVDEQARYIVLSVKTDDTEALRKETEEVASELEQISKIESDLDEIDTDLKEVYSLLEQLQ